MRKPRRQPKSVDGKNPFMEDGAMDLVVKAMSTVLSEETGEEIVITFTKKEKEDDAG